jgi:hypothetical protein
MSTNDLDLGMDSIFNEKLLDRIYMIIRILFLRLSGRKP